ncbi:MAG: branched-chain amino acid ABC transporter permease [Burkholderiales bacterium]
MFDLAIVAQLAWTGFATASFYCLSAISFALVLKVNQVWNFAQAGVMVIAYYALYVGMRVLGMPLVAGLVFALVITLLASWAIERFAFDVLRRRRSSVLTYFIFTIMFAQFAIYIAELVFGTEPKTITNELISPVFMVGPIAVSHWDLSAIAITAMLSIALYVFLNKTNTGQCLIAVADNAELAETYGIDPRRAYIIAMLLAGVLLLACMYLFGTKAALFPSTPLTQLLMYNVIATILAGLGNVFAAGVVAVLLSVIQAFSILVIESRWQVLLAYALIFVAILLFPKGVVLPRRIRLARRDPPQGATSTPMSKPR